MLQKYFSRLTNIFLLTVSFYSLNIYSQVTLEWVARYNGPSNFSEYVSAMALDSSGNVYVTGRDSEDPPGFVTVKFNSNGQFVWARRFLGTPPIIAGPVSIEVDLQGNVYVGALDGDYIVIKYNANGIQQWVKRYRGSGGGSHVLREIRVYNHDSIGIVATGYVKNAVTNWDVGIVKYNTSGDILWARNYNQNGSNDEGAIAINKNSQTTIDITGFSGYRDFLTLSYDLDGNLRWARTWDGHANGWDQAYDIASDKQGNVFVTGYGVMNSINNDEDIVTIKYDSEGNEKWVRFYDGTGQYFISRGEFIKVDTMGNIIISGYQVLNSYDWCTIKYDSLGSLLWARQYTGPGNNWDLVEGLTVDDLGSVYVTGTSSETANLYRITTIKYDKDGNQVWLRKYPDGDTISSPRAIIVDKNLNVYVAGISYNPSDIIVLKYSQPSSVVPLSDEIPKNFKLYQNYPNPFNSKSKIKMEISNSGFVKLSVCDVLGKGVKVLVNQKLQAGIYEAEFSAGSGDSELPSGIYYYTLTVKDIDNNSEIYSDTKKMILIK